LGRSYESSGRELFVLKHKKTNFILWIQCATLEQDDSTRDSKSSDTKTGLAEVSCTKKWESSKPVSKNLRLKIVSWLKLVDGWTDGGQINGWM
jgi:hypothetical protein